MFEFPKRRGWSANRTKQLPRQRQFRGDGCGAAVRSNRQFERDVFWALMQACPFRIRPVIKLGRFFGS